jgi:hypothetical protein
MNRGSKFILKTLRWLYSEAFGKVQLLKPSCILDSDIASQEIFNALTSPEPRMIARFGSNELVCMTNYIGVKAKQRHWIKYIRGTALPWWWEPAVIRQMNICAGFFPPNIPALEYFSELMIQDTELVDILGSWLPNEECFAQQLQRTKRVHLELLNPYFSKSPWTRALEGKKVLVIHPFAATIQAQYKRRELLFANNLLPAFELKTIKAVQSIAGEKTEFDTWFDALDHMKAQMDQVDYDICLIGCGAYGFPLAAHAKRMGNVGFHLGGSLQLLFGIRGKRWENPDYNPVYNYAALMNEHWVKPAEEERPVAANKVEGACYW